MPTSQLRLVCTVSYVQYCISPDLRVFLRFGGLTVTKIISQMRGKVKEDS